MDETYPEFEKALLQFEQFLIAQGWPPEVLWIRPGDVRRRWGRLIIRSVPRAIGEAHARRVYANAVAARLGVMLEGVCGIGAHTFARVVRPVDGDASSRGLFPDGLKLSVPVERFEARFITSRWRWLLSAAASPCPPNDADLDA